jgi:hypothetical protein
MGLGRTVIYTPFRWVLLHTGTKFLRAAAQEGLQPSICESKPKEKSYKVWDDRGLYMLVTPTGGRL